MKGAHGRQRWLAGVGVYAVSGLAGAIGVGMLVGHVAAKLRVFGSSVFFTGLLIASSLMFYARTVGLLHFAIPQYSRQTEKVWAHEFSIITAAAMWGLHIGVAFLTRISYGGLWILVLAILSIGDEPFAAGVMLTYWFGRVLPLFFAPILWDRGDIRLLLDDAIMAAQSYRRAHGAALIWTALLGCRLFWRVLKHGH